jgi:hypothetical protein
MLCTLFFPLKVEFDYLITKAKLEEGEELKVRLSCFEKMGGGGGGVAGAAIFY